MNLREFIEFNISVTSEMFISVMSILHQRLPNSEYIYRQRKIFKRNEINRNKKTIQDYKKQSFTEIETEIQAEEICMSPLKAIASPKIMISW